MDARGPAASIACPRCKAEQPPGGDRMRTCAACGLVFDTTKAQAAMDVVERRAPEIEAPRRLRLSQLEIPGVVTPTALWFFIAAVAMFVIGFIGQPADMETYSRRFWISIGLRGAGLLAFFIAVVHTRNAKLRLTETELICERSWRKAVHVPREGLALGIEAVPGLLRSEYVIVARSNGQTIPLVSRIDADEARAQVEILDKALG